MQGIGPEQESQALDLLHLLEAHLIECGPLEKGMANHFSILSLRTPMNSMKRQNDKILKQGLPRSVGTQYATGDQWTNNSRKNEGMEPKQKQHPVVDVTGDRSKVQ